MSKEQTGHAHSHMWMIGMLGLISGLLLMIYVPSLKPVSDVIFLFAGFHLVGAVVSIASIYVMTGGKPLRHILRRPVETASAVPEKSAAPEKFDFGWTPSWTIGPLIGSVISISTAVAIQVAAPHFWSLAMLLTLLAACFFAGHLAAESTARPGNAALPAVDLLSSEHDVVLDGGCGAGRTTVALSRMLKHGRIVAMDRFDSDYIEGGGRRLLEQNIKLASIADRVEIKQGDLTQLPFPDASFDAAVSAHAIDHLGEAKEKGLAEMRRVVKPGGRFLLVVWVPGWNMFAIANVLSFFLTSKAGWRQMAARAGFEIQDEGDFNGVWYLLLRSPAPQPQV